MTPTKCHVGMLVDHPTKPEWGPGKVVAVLGRNLRVYFRDVLEQGGGGAIQEISLDQVQLTPARSQSDPRLDTLPVTVAGKVQHFAPSWTLSQAIASFLEKFPLGFKDPAYSGDKNRGERIYKWYAHAHFVKTLGGGQGERLLEHGQLAEVTRRAVAVVQKVNLLYRHELMALRDGLKDPKAAHRFFQGLFDVLAAPKPERDRFERYIDAVEALPYQEGKTHPAKWTVLTVLPFLARPDTFMFLKPRVTMKAADWLAFSPQYDSKLNWRTYERLLALSDLFMGELMKRPEPGMHPRDLIDIQSFIWVVGHTAAVANAAGEQ